MFDEYLNIVLPDKNNQQIVVSVDMLDTGIMLIKKHSPKWIDKCFNFVCVDLFAPQTSCL